MRACVWVARGAVKKLKKMLADGFVGWFWALQNHGSVEKQSAPKNRSASTPSQIPTQTTAKEKVSKHPLCCICLCECF